MADYTTRDVCAEALQIARCHFRTIEKAVPPARWVLWENVHNWRFIEQLPAQLLLQKFARQIVGIQAIDLLLLGGQLQEIGVLYRSLDEIAEDIIFICLGLRPGAWTPSHEVYARYFWSEDASDRQPPLQKKVRAYISNALGELGSAGYNASGREIYKTYSDYTHAIRPHNGHGQGAAFSLRSGQNLR